MIADLEELVASAVTEIFSTMLGMNMRPAPLESGFANGETHIAGAVGFVGRLSGVVYVFTTVSFARRITADDGTAESTGVTRAPIDRQHRPRHELRRG